jgi:hypothetical protein
VNRRHFLLSAAAAASPLAAREHAATLSIHPDRPAGRIPARYAGLSYESSQLAEPEFFSPRNRELVALFRRLSDRGVLRLGGNSSEFTWWKASPEAVAPPLKRPEGRLEANWMPHELAAITPQAIDDLAGFLDETGWKLIYGLNLGTGTPERAAEEAAWVARVIGPRLEYFQIGNEPDLYPRANNGLRPPSWGFDDYLAEWMRFTQAIRARVPGAVFAGPDVASDSDWIARFASQAGGSVAALTGHYYAAGPPDDPRVTIARLLGPDPGPASKVARIARISAEAHLPFRMAEGNSCYRGGKPGMSDTFASALWSADYMLMTAQAGYAGVNFHGGGGRQIRAALGGHFPGEALAKKPGAGRAGAFYTPIAGSLDEGFAPRPIFYGILLANQFAGTTPVAADFDPKGVNATAYAARTDTGIRVAVLNKDAARDLRVTIDPQAKAGLARVWRLSAPALDATEGVTLAGRAIMSDGSWSPQEEVLRPDARGRFTVNVGHASGALVFFVS